MSLKTWKDKDAQRVAAQVSEVASHSKDFAIILQAAFC